jgi:hypothetical protein
VEMRVNGIEELPRHHEANHAGWLGAIESEMESGRFLSQTHSDAMLESLMRFWDPSFALYAQPDADEQYD